MKSDDTMHAEERFYDSPSWDGARFNHQQHRGSSRRREAQREYLLRKYGTADPVKIATRSR